MSAAIRTLPSPLCLDDFDLGVTLGTGSFGRVRFVTHKVKQTRGRFRGFAGDEGGVSSRTLLASAQQ